jgi:hypothetical protein
MTTPDVTLDPQRPSRVLSEHIGAPYQACAIVYNAILTGILLSVAMRRGAEAAGEVGRLRPVPLPSEQRRGRARRVHARVRHQGVGAFPPPTLGVPRTRHLRDSP